MPDYVLDPDTGFVTPAVDDSSAAGSSATGAPLEFDPAPEDQATVTVTGHTNAWLWWVVAFGVGYYLLKEAKLVK